MNNSLDLIKTRYDNEVKYELVIHENYESLVDTYLDALVHASVTKGKERHANGEPFENQTICQTNKDVGLGYGLGQCIKKCKEVVKLTADRGILELYGVINYASGVIIVLKESIKGK